MPEIGIKELDSDGEFQETLTIDLTPEVISDFRIGQKIEVTIKGSVGMLSVPPDGASEDFPPDMGIRVESKSIKLLDEFADLIDDDED